MLKKTGRSLTVSLSTYPIKVCQINACSGLGTKWKWSLPINVVLLLWSASDLEDEVNQVRSLRSLTNNFSEFLHLQAQGKNREGRHSIMLYRAVPCLARLRNPLSLSAKQARCLCSRVSCNSPDFHIRKLQWCYWETLGICFPTSEWVQHQEKEDTW